MTQEQLEEMYEDSAYVTLHYEFDYDEYELEDVEVTYNDVYDYCRSDFKSDEEFNEWYYEEVYDNIGELLRDDDGFYSYLKEAYSDEARQLCGECREDREDREWMERSSHYW